jgi:hypothetical protein
LKSFKRSLGEERGESGMSILRYIDSDGHEQDVDDVNHLHYLIKSRQIGQDSLIWDDDETRWIPSRNHEFFRRIRDIAAETPPAETRRVRTLAPPAAPPEPRQPDPPPVPRISPPQTTPYYTSPLMQHRNSTPHPTINKGVQEKTEISWFWPIKSREEALEIVQLASWLLFIVAGLLAILSLVASIYPDVGLHWQDYVLDLVLYAAFGTWLRWGNSRVAALLSFSMALLSLGTTVAAKAGLTEGGKNIWLAVGAAWATAKAVEATFKLHGRFKEVSDPLSQAQHQGPWSLKQ